MTAQFAVRGERAQMADIPQCFSVVAGMRRSTSPVKAEEIKKNKQEKEREKKNRGGSLRQLLLEVKEVL